MLCEVPTSMEMELAVRIGSDLAILRLDFLSKGICVDNPVNRRNAHSNVPYLLSAMLLVVLELSILTWRVKVSKAFSVWVEGLHRCLASVDAALTSSTSSPCPSTRE